MQLFGCFTHHVYAMTFRKWILSVFLTFLSISSYAQTFEFEPLLTQDRETLYLGDIPLTESTRDSVFVKTLGEDFIRQWEKNAFLYDTGRQMFKASLGAILIGGVSIFIGSFQMLDIIIENISYPISSFGPDSRTAQSSRLMAFAGTYYSMAGALALVTGVAFRIQGRTEMSRMVSSHNDGRAVSLTFGPTKSGNVGFALNF